MLSWSNTTLQKIHGKRRTWLLKIQFGQTQWGYQIEAWQKSVVKSLNGKYYH